MRKLLLIATLFISNLAPAQVCTVTGASPYNWPGDGASVSCAEGGTATAATVLVIPAGMRVVFDNSADTWSGTRIEVYGTLQVSGNPVINASITVKSGGFLDLRGKLSLGEAATPGCDYDLVIDRDGLVRLAGGNAAERLLICGSTMMKGAGDCNDCSETYSSQCPYDGKPYCQPDGGFLGPLAFDTDGYNGSLPVKLLYLNIEVLNETVTLDWGTIMEENFYHFVVQRSIDGKTFQDIGVVAGQGFNIYDFESKYSFLDEAPMLGTNYYRLQAVDHDNRYEYSTVKAVKVEGSIKLAVYPNPSNGERVAFRANFNSQESDRIILIDPLGVEVFSGLASSTDNSIVFPNALQPGVYILRYVSKDYEQVTRVVVRH